MIAFLAGLAGGYSVARVLEAQEAGVPLDRAFKAVGQPVARLRRAMDAEAAAASAAAAAAAAPKLKAAAAKLAAQRRKAEMGAFRIPRRAFRLMQGGGGR